MKHQLPDHFPAELLVVLLASACLVAGIVALIWYTDHWQVWAIVVAVLVAITVYGAMRK